MVTCGSHKPSTLETHRVSSSLTPATNFVVANFVVDKSKNHLLVDTRGEQSRD